MISFKFQYYSTIRISTSFLVLNLQVPLPYFWIYVFKYRPPFSEVFRFKLVLDAIISYQVYFLKKITYQISKAHIAGFSFEWHIVYKVNVVYSCTRCRWRLFHNIDTPLFSNKSQLSLDLTFRSFVSPWKMKFLKSQLLSFESFLLLFRVRILENRHLRQFMLAICFFWF